MCWPRPMPATDVRHRDARRLVSALLLVLLPYPAAADGLGQTLYQQGLANVTARLEAAELELSSTRMPCASCHGASGAGGSEGGVAVPSIQWQRLSRPLASRPAYDERSLATALRDGIDPAGRKLHPAMPRYAVPDSLALDLVAALRQLERPTATGVTPDTIRIAAPALGNGDVRSSIVRLVLERYVEALNAKGGIYGRAIALVDDPTTAFAGIARPGASTAALDLWPLVEAPSAFRLLPASERIERSWRRHGPRIRTPNGSTLWRPAIGRTRAPSSTAAPCWRWSGSSPTGPKTSHLPSTSSINGLRSDFLRGCRGGA
jgi:hypothetical protein